ncbi:MAG: hypothetical protein ACRCYC_12330 [Paraclostridium sp.]|uniref:hypothetical protein n=1 Tax=Paraclostridium sp. TaxID=2023273 RepID=UPI003F30174F
MKKLRILLLLVVLFLSACGIKPYDLPQDELPNKLNVEDSNQLDLGSKFGYQDFQLSNFKKDVTDENLIYTIDYEFSKDTFDFLKKHNIEYSFNLTCSEEIYKIIRELDDTSIDTIQGITNFPKNISGRITFKITTSKELASKLKSSSLDNHIFKVTDMTNYPICIIDGVNEIVNSQNNVRYIDLDKNTKSK